MSQTHRAGQAQKIRMSEPRAQRQVAPTHLLSKSGELRSSTAPGFGPADSFIAFAHAVLRREAASLAASKPKTEQAPTPDEIHQLRVAARRLRVALRLFGPMLPSKDPARVNPELRWFAPDGMHPGPTLTLFEALLLYREIQGTSATAASITVKAPIFTVATGPALEVRNSKAAAGRADVPAGTEYDRQTVAALLSSMDQ